MTPPAGPKPPVIDVHTHTFNASDLSVKGFLAEVIADSDETFPWSVFDALIRFLAGLVGRAPGADAELRRLDERLALRNAGLQNEADERDAREQAEDDAEFENLLVNEIERLRSSPEAGDRELYERIVAESGTDLVALSTDASRLIAYNLLIGWGSIKRYIKWVKRLRRYRWDIISELVRTYGTTNRRVDLFISAQVDFALWLNDKPVTRQSAQVALGDRLTRAFPGRIHFFAAFDPWLEVDNPGQPDGSLRHVQQAVESRGFIGVKLYPPMGFSAIGNEGHDFSRLPTQAPPDFGLRLDAALETLYEWAEREDVPLMAHCNNSNSPKHDYGLRASPDYWERVIDKHPKLRLNLGHFGGQKNLGIGNGWPATIIRLMSNTKSTSVYADIGMFDLHSEHERDKWFKALLAEIGKESVIAERMMYGSDWMMLAKEAGAGDYFTDFERELRHRLPQHVDAILGGNAARFLGLSGKTGTSRRLKAYYTARGLATPGWLSG